MAIKVDTTAYRASHWSEPKPSQDGEWGFEFEGFTYWVNAPYRTAVAEVKRVIRRDRKVQDATITVCP